MQGVTFNPLTAINQATQRPELPGYFDSKGILDGMNGAHLIGNRADPAHPRGDVGHLGVILAFEELVAFYFDGGRQGEPGKGEGYNAWAVSPGDTLAPVPVPGAVWLFSSALGLMGWMHRKVCS